MFSACIITKNEEKNIERCLAALKNIGCEIVVADSGSTDNTVELARKFTDNVYFFEWENDFSKAKNFVASKASNDLIISVDADEVLTLGARAGENLGALVNSDALGRIALINHMGEGENDNFDNVSRAYDRRRFEFKGAIHEQLVPVKDVTVRFMDVDAKLEHFGYMLSGEELHAKCERNLLLLMNEERTLRLKLKADGENKQIREAFNYCLYQIARTYYIDKLYAKALEYLDELTGYDLNTELDYVQDMIEMYGYTLLESGHEERALGFEGLYDTFARTADFHFLMGLIYMKNARFEDAVNEFKLAAGYDRAKIYGVNSFLAYYNCGVIKEVLGSTDEAIAFYEKCGSYAKAVKQLEKLTK